MDEPASDLAAANPLMTVTEAVGLSMPARNETSVQFLAFKHAGMQIIAGGSAGCVEVCCAHPLDVVKTRFQLQTQAFKTATAQDLHIYSGVVDCVRKIIRGEGFQSLWKGLIPPILVETPKRAVKFATFEQYKQLFMFGSATPTTLTFSMAGLAAGVTEALLVNPFEVVKVRLQSDRSPHSQGASAWAVTRNITNEHGFGLKGLSLGLPATCLRNGTFNMVYFGFVYTVKPLLPDDPKLETVKKLGVGFAGGVLGSCCNLPFDVAKSRIQQGLAPEKYRTVSGTIKVVWAEEGFRALYKGLLPKCLRFGPGGAIMLAVYEHVYDFLKKRFPD